MEARIRVFTTVRAAQSQSIATWRWYKLSAQAWGTGILVLATLVSACIFMNIKLLQGRLYNAWQVCQQLTDHYRLEHEQLLLERNHWASPDRIHAVAQRQLGMKAPAVDSIIIVRSMDYNKRRDGEQVVVRTEPSQLAKLGEVKEYASTQRSLILPDSENH